MNVNVPVTWVLQLDPPPTSRALHALADAVRVQLVKLEPHRAVAAGVPEVTYLGVLTGVNTLTVQFNVRLTYVADADADTHVAYDLLGRATPYLAGELLGRLRTALHAVGLGTTAPCWFSDVVERRLRVELARDAALAGLRPPLSTPSVIRVGNYPVDVDLR